MKKLKELSIIKEQLSVIKNSNKDLEIDNLIVQDIQSFKDNFFLENIEFFIDKKLVYNCQLIIRNFDKEKLEPYLEKLINVIADSDNYNVMIDLLHYNRYIEKDNDKRPLKDFQKQNTKMMGRIHLSNDPIVYLRAAMYYHGMRWKFLTIPFKERERIEDTILSYDFKKYNLQYEINTYFDKTQEPHTYFELLLTYCKDYFNGHRWPEAEQRVFKFAPYYMKQYIEEVVKWKDSEIEDILFEMNEPELYFDYAKNNIKGEWESLRTDKHLKDPYNPTKEKIIDAALDSIASSPYYVMQYSTEIVKGRLSPKMEEKMLIELNKKINYYYLQYFHFEDVTHIYLYLSKFKERFPLFEEFLIKLNDLKEGLDLDNLFYGPEEEDHDDFDDEDDEEFFDDFNEGIQFKKLLDEIIYNYTVTNRNGLWSEIGINNKKDLLKLRRKVVEKGSYNINLQGYGELDY
jgi:hypothetical protein